MIPVFLPIFDEISELEILQFLSAYLLQGRYMPTYNNSCVNKSMHPIGFGQSL